jgi:tetratricopeptide (TPR) repeat protein
MAVVTLEEAPRKTRELYQKAAAAVERDNLDYAIDMLLSVTELEPKLLEARKLLRAAEIKKFREAKKGELHHTISNLTGAFTVMSVNSQMKKDPIKALQTAEKLLRADPLNKNFLVLHANAALAADLPETAVHSAEIAKENNAQDVALLTQAAEIFTDAGLTRQARECYETIVALKPNDQKALKMMKDAAALDTMKSGGWDDAKDYRDVIKDKDEAKRLEQVSKAVKTSTDISDMIEQNLKKIEQEPENINYRRALADLYAKAEQFDEALEVLEAAQKKTGGGDPQVDLAINRIRIQSFDKEIETLRASGDESGATQKEAEKEQFCLEDAAERVRRYPNDLQFKYELGVLLFEHGQFTEAVQQFQLAQRNPQRRIRALYYLALCFKQKEQYDIAAEQLEKAASELHSMDETKKDILYELGLLNEAMGRTEKAHDFFKQIYAVDIGYKEVAQKIEKTYKSS